MADHRHSHTCTTASPTATASGQPSSTSSSSLLMMLHTLDQLGGTCLVHVVPAVCRPKASASSSDVTQVTHIVSDVSHHPAPLVAITGGGNPRLSLTTDFCLKCYSAGEVLSRSIFKLKTQLFRLRDCSMSAFN